MKTYFCRLGLAALFVSAPLHAMEANLMLGNEYNEIQGNFGTKGSGLTLGATWLHSESKGQIGSLDATFGLPLGPINAYVGGKGRYSSIKHYRQDLMMVTGGGLIVPLFFSFSLQGEMYAGPAVFSAKKNRYFEQKIGLKYDVLRPLSLEGGYRKIGVDNSDKAEKKRLFEGFYFGASVSF